MRKSTYYSVDEFIDKLIEVQKTVISSEVCHKFDTLTFLKAEYESGNLPPIELYEFRRDPSKLSGIIEISANMLISKPPFLCDNGLRHELLKWGKHEEIC